jgi:hypothetical protein
MSNEHESGSPAAAERTQGGGGSATELEQEVVRLRAQLAEAAADAERYRRAAYALLSERVPYTPPSEEELRDMLHGPRGRPLAELIEELEREGEG